MNMCSWGLRCASDSELAAAVVEHSVAFRDFQLVSTRRVLHRLVRICKTYDVVVVIWVSISTTTAVDDSTVLRTPREEWKYSAFFVRLSLNSLTSS